MKFLTAEQMLEYINDNHDLYSRKAQSYVFNYNEKGSICIYEYIDEEEAKTLSKQGKELGEYWGALLGSGGKIFDDPSHECYNENQATNLDLCETLKEYDDWVLTQHYPEEDLEINVKTTIQFKKEDIDDIMCAALEGGITYWADEASVVDEYLGEFANEQISRGGSLWIHDSEENEFHELDLDKFLKGISIWFEKGYDRYGAVTSNGVDTCNIDGSAADRIVQCALFGDIIYG